MDMEAAQRIDRATWKRYLFYLDLCIIAVFAVSLILLVRHSFLGGQWYERGELQQTTDLLWMIVADAAFLVASLAWIFYRFFRNQYLVMTRKF